MRFIPRRLTKKQRLAKIMTTIDVDNIKELPEEITLEQDGKTMHGDRWVKPSDYQDADDQAGLLPAWKGITPVELPMLNSDQEHKQ